MDRVATLTFIIRTCVDCPNVKKWMKNGIPVPTIGATCKYLSKEIDNWNSIPSWCPLPEVVDVKEEDIVKELENKKE
jgi:hypothetical protein